MLYKSFQNWINKLRNKKKNNETLYYNYYIITFCK